MTSDDDHDEHLAVHATFMPSFDPSRFPKRNTWSERFAYRVLRRELPMTRPRAEQAQAAMAEHVRAHQEAVEAISGVCPLSRGSFKFSDITEA